jgi:hypothetical protein
MFIVQASSVSLCRGIEVAIDPYRPELYYMRGPGPKWRAKHLRPAGNGSF